MSSRYLPIGDYGVIGDCRTAALISRNGSIDWCCLPRFDHGSWFARLLDYDRGGYCAVSPSGDFSSSREYLDDTLVLVTTFRSEGGQARLIDCMPLGGEAGSPDRRQIVRIVEGQLGSVDVELEIAPRFDYGAVDPWIRRHDESTFGATGGDDGLLIWSDVELEEDHRMLRGSAKVRAGERVRLVLESVAPAQLPDAVRQMRLQPPAVDESAERTIAAWRRWSAKIRPEGRYSAGVKRSAILLKGLTYAPTGAILAAPTTSLPEGAGAEGGRNWDYRYSWIRDSILAVRSLAQLGCAAEAEAFREFVERSAAGNARNLQVTFGVGGERRLEEVDLDGLEGYRGAQPVKVGNAAATQLQLDSFGQIVDQSWRWYERGHEPDDDYWNFLVELVETAIERWQEPDSGIWEHRGEPLHFVHSKVLVWAAADRGLKLAEHCMRKAPESRWRKAREEIRDAVEEHGYDEDRGVFVRTFGSEELDAALLRLPTVDFVAWDDERMIRTADAVSEDLAADGLIRRYAADDGIGVREGAFVACTFWLAECLARQRRLDDAQKVFDRAMSAANDLALFSEVFDPAEGEMLGNFPQGISHLSHIEAAIALAEAHGPAAEPEVTAGSTEAPLE